MVTTVGQMPRFEFQPHEYVGEFPSPQCHTAGVNPFYTVNKDDMQYIDMVKHASDLLQYQQFR